MNKQTHQSLRLVRYVADDNVHHSPLEQLHSHHQLEEASEQKDNVEVLEMKEEWHEQNFLPEREMEEESRFKLKPSDNSEEQHH